MASTQVKLWKLKLKVSLGAVLRVLRHPGYALLSVALSGLTVLILLWFFNINLLVYVFGAANISLLDKAIFFFRGFESLVTNVDSLPAAVLLVFGVMSGINLAVLVYLLRRAGKQAALAGGGKNAGGAVAALIGSGCAACGSSVLGPLLGLFGASISIGVARQIGVLANIIGICLVAYSIYGLGHQVASSLAAERLAPLLHTDAESN